MKKIEVTLRPSAYVAVRSVLQSLGLHAMALSRVEAIDRRRAEGEPGELASDARSAVRLELVVADDLTPHVRDEIANCLRAAGRGTGRILISRVDEIVELGAQPAFASRTELPVRNRS